MKPETAAASAAPPTAIRVWSDGLWLFVELPGEPPYIQKLSLTEGGLWKAINLLKERAAPAPINPNAGRLIMRKIGRMKVAATNGERVAATEVLKRMGLI